MAELEDFLDLAVARLQRLPEQLPPRSLGPAEYRILLTGLSGVLGQAHDWIGDFGWRRDGSLYPSDHHPADQPFQEPLDLIAAARRQIAPLLTEDRQLLDAYRDDPAVRQVTDAARMLSLAREVVRTHFSPDGAALTAYGRLVATPGGHRFVLTPVSNCSPWLV